MANEKHFKMLKQGVKGWNKWREKDPKLRPDLVGLNLEHADLADTNLFRADLARAQLRNTNLARSNLGWADLSEADLTRANLTGAFLSGAIFHRVILNRTLLTNVDLSAVENLKTANHHGPSTVGIDTLQKTAFGLSTRPRAKYPAGQPGVRKSVASQLDVVYFLRGTGVAEDVIEVFRTWIKKRAELYSCFISYSHKDESFVKRLHNDLQENGVRCWFAPEDIKIGDKIRFTVDQSIRVHDKLLIILSEQSIRSVWVEHEVEAALDKEATQGNVVLFPIRLDDAVMDIKVGWAAKIRRERHIGDFSKWKNYQSYRKAFVRLLHDLKSKSAQT